MSHRLLADALVAIHFAFIVFAIGGGLIVLFRPWVALLHLPSVAWAIYTELAGAICPLTPWEQALRRSAGQAGYAGGFIEHYLIPVIYPAGLTPVLQTALGVGVFVINAAIYAIVWKRWRKARLAARARLGVHRRGANQGL